MTSQVAEPIAEPGMEVEAQLGGTVVIGKVDFRVEGRGDVSVFDKVVGNTLRGRTMNGYHCDHLPTTETYALRAEPADGWKFDVWYMNGSWGSSKLERLFRPMKDGLDILAVFVPKG